MNWRDKFQIRTLAYVIIAVLIVCAIVFAGIAGHFVLAAHYPAHIAALLTAAGFIIMALLVLGISTLLTKQWSRGRRGRAKNPADDLETALAASIEPVIGDWIRRNPGSATAMGLLLGVAAGYSDSVRRVLQDTYNRYTDGCDPEK